MPYFAVRQAQADHVALLVQLEGVTLATVVTTGYDAVVGVVLYFQFFG